MENQNKLQKLLVKPIGLGLFALAICVSRFLPESNVTHFIIGFLVGLSLVFIINSFRKKQVYQ
jgi:hypothetical protein